MKKTFQVSNAKRRTDDGHVGATPQHTEPSKALRRCGHLADSNDLLGLFLVAVRKAGLIGEPRNAAILFLSIISRLLVRPVSIVVKGARSGGKSTLVKIVLQFFPESAFHKITGMSDKATAYYKDGLKHKTLFVEEAAGLKHGGDYFLRSLLSEGCVTYKAVAGKKTETYKIDGPTQLILTTTEVKLYEDDESRLLSVEVIENSEHTREVLNSIGEDFAHPRKQKGKKVPGCWPAMMELIAKDAPEVRIPFAPSVSQLMAASDTRLLRDAKSLFGLVSSHALLHIRHRKRDSRGHLLATLEDYKAVRELVHDILARGVEAAVSPPVRRLVESVKRLSSGSAGVSGRQLSDAMQLNKANISRHAKTARDLGYIRNLEEGSGKPAKYVPGDPMPTDANVIPTARAVRRHHRALKAKRVKKKAK